MPPPMYHPERGEPPVPLWANKPEPGPSTRIPQTEDAMNDARRINVNIIITPLSDDPLVMTATLSLVSPRL